MARDEAHRTCNDSRSWTSTGLDMTDLTSTSHGSHSKAGYEASAATLDTGCDIEA